MHRTDLSREIPAVEVDEVQISPSRPWAGKTYLQASEQHQYATEYDPGGRPVRVTMPGYFGEAVIEVLYEYFDDNQVKTIVARNIAGDAPVEIYAIEYIYDSKGRKSRQVVWNSREDAHPVFDARYEYDNRDQLLSEKYYRYNAVTEVTELYRGRVYTYDNGGSMTKKKIIELDEWIEHTFAYNAGYMITDWDITVSSGSVTGTGWTPTYDANGNMTGHDTFTITGGPDQFELQPVSFTYDVNNRLKTYQMGDEPECTLYWDALGRIREKTWTVDSTDYHQVFYHDGRQLVQIWKQETSGEIVSRSIEYDLYRGQTGYLKDIDFEADPNNETYFIKDEQGTVRRLVWVTWSGGAYTIDVGDIPLDAYGDWFDPTQLPANGGAHYMRYISCRVEGYADPSTENQALLHTDHRHYYAPLGVFLQREPRLVSGSLINWISSGSLSLSPYCYSNNSPSEFFDPSGLFSQKCVDRIKSCRIVYDSNNSNCWKKFIDRVNDYTKCKQSIDDWHRFAYATLLASIASCFLFCGLSGLLRPLQKPIKSLKFSPK